MAHKTIKSKKTSSYYTIEFKKLMNEAERKIQSHDEFMDFCYGLQWRLQNIVEKHQYPEDIDETVYEMDDSCSFSY